MKTNSEITETLNAFSRRRKELEWRLNDVDRRIIRLQIDFNVNYDKLEEAIEDREYVVEEIRKLSQELAEFKID